MSPPPWGSVESLLEPGSGTNASRSPPRPALPGGGTNAPPPPGLLD
jgi:hypothetical protein